jgi:hypothetical protein
MDEASSHGAIISLTKKKPQRSLQVRLSLTKGGKGKEEKVGSWKVESPDEIQGEFIKGGKGTFLGWTCQEI